MTEKRAKRTYTEKFKKQLLELYNNGKPRSEIIKEYDLTPSAFDKWAKRINATGSSKVTDGNMSAFCWIFTTGRSSDSVPAPIKTLFWYGQPLLP